MHDAHSALYVRLRREAFATLAGDFEVGFFPFMIVCHTVSVVEGCGSNIAAQTAMKVWMGKGCRGKLLAEAALPLSYCPYAGADRIRTNNMR